jgi:hypothetical protein
MAGPARARDVTPPSIDEMAETLSLTIMQSVTVLKGAADLLDGSWRDLPEEQRVELAHMVRRHADHLASVVEDFRDHPVGATPGSSGP